MPVITIARQFAAGGEPVAQIVARKLGADLLDKKIVAEVARRLEIPDAEVEDEDEAPGSFLTRLLTSLGTTTIEFSAPPEVAAWAPPYSDPAFDPRKAILSITQQVVLEAARTGNAVIVGRGSAYLLRDEPDALHVFLQAPVEARLRNAVELFGVPEEVALKRMKQTDANRAAYIRQVYGHDWLHPSHYHLIIDTDRLGFEPAADVILAAARPR